MKVSFLFYIVRLMQHLRPFLIGWKCPNSGPEQGSTENPAYIRENVQLSFFFISGPFTLQYLLVRLDQVFGPWIASPELIRRLYYLALVF